MKENEIHKLLETAQATYGYANQVVVAIEELCELGAVLSKYPRYDFHDDAVEALRDKVLEETADAIIVLKHIQMIFGIQPDELDNMMDKKLNRLKRWLENDNKSFQHTTEDRAVEPEESKKIGCENCYYWEHVSDNAPCSECLQYHNLSPINTEVCDEPK
jgi:hypothetical protein